MRYHTIADSPRKPVSHDPSLIKSLLVEEGVLPGIRDISHIILPKGTEVESHVHENGHEVFFCMGGRGIALVGGEEKVMEKGDCLIVEPGEPHGFKVMSEDMELVYLFIAQTP